MSDAALRARSVSREQLIAELRALMPEFIRAGVTHMTLFGSRARQDNRPDSDVDVAIEVDPKRKFSLVDLIGVEHVIVDNVGLVANAQMRRSLSPKFHEELARDGLDIF
ncbi:MAG TPA: nucleotidyltransferase domain-containing protein [Bauldia sp.]|nr:nucleotidyltransferase domain-containing protein [Bauldia sp.]